MKQFLETGEIVNTHGIRGEVKLLPWADERKRECHNHSLYLCYMHIIAFSYKYILALKFIFVNNFSIFFHIIFPRFFQK